MLSSELRTWFWFNGCVYNVALFERSGLTPRAPASDVDHAVSALGWPVQPARTVVLLQLHGHAPEALWNEKCITSFENMLLALNRQDYAPFEQKYELVHWVVSYDRFMSRAGPQSGRNLPAA